MVQSPIKHAVPSSCLTNTSSCIPYFGETSWVISDFYLFSRQNTDFMTKFYWFHFHNNFRHSLHLQCALEDQDKISWLSASMREPIQATLIPEAKGFLQKCEVHVMALSHSLSSESFRGSPLSKFLVWHMRSPRQGTLLASSCIIHPPPRLCPTFQYITCSSTMQWLC